MSAKKNERNPVKIKLNNTPTPTKPFEIIHFDTLIYVLTELLRLHKIKIKSILKNILKQTLVFRYN